MKYRLMSLFSPRELMCISPTIPEATRTPVIPEAVGEGVEAAVGIAAAAARSRACWSRETGGGAGAGCVLIQDSAATTLSQMEVPLKKGLNSDEPAA